MGVFGCGQPENILLTSEDDDGTIKVGARQAALLLCFPTWNATRQHVGILSPVDVGVRLWVFSNRGRGLCNDAMRHAHLHGAWFV